MRLLVVLLTGVGLVGCSQPTSALPGREPPRAENFQALSGLMGACGEAQSAVATALQSTDLAAAAYTVGKARDDCSAAATQLRKTPMPNMDSTLGADGIDDMASGLGQIEEALREFDQAPAAAKRKAQQGMQAYKQGLGKLERAKA